MHRGRTLSARRLASLHSTAGRLYSGAWLNCLTSGFNNFETAAEAGTKLGGTAEWIQVEWKQSCCGQPMWFLGQIDSLDVPAARLPDSSIVYVVYCPKCFSVAAQMQSA